MPFQYLRNIATLELDATRCTGCGMCLDVCPHAVFRQTNGTAEIADRDACMECGACALNCPAGAIEVRPGVGCAAALLAAKLKKSDAPCCGP